MAQLAVVLPYIKAIGTVLSVIGAFRSGSAADAAAKAESAQLKQNAGQERAASQREALEQRRQAKLLSSRAQAIAGKQGGALDPSVVENIADIDAEGEYRKMVALYGGESRAQGIEYGAKVKRYQGQTTKSAYQMKGLSTLLSGGASLGTTYGGGTQDDLPPVEDKGMPAPFRFYNYR